jgi:nucleotide-binding universal stress UspA family protein
VWSRLRLDLCLKLLHPLQHFLLANQALLGEQFHQRIERQHVRVGQFLEADSLAVALGTMTDAFNIQLNKLEVNVVRPKVIVALRDPESVESLRSLAIHLSNSMDAELVALHVVEVPLATPIETEDEILDHPGKETLAAAAARVAEKSSKKLSTELLRAREAGGAIVGEANDRGAELLIEGDRGSHPSALGELVLGSTAQYVGHHAPCRVIIQIPLPEPG